MPRKINENKLLEAALKIWVDHGYAGTTTLQVAKLAGVNETTLFRRYGDKAGLMLRAISEPLLKVPLRALTITGDVEDDLKSIVESYLQTNRQVGAIVPLLLVEASRHPELRPALELTWENLGALIKTIEHHQAAGSLQPGPPLTLLASLIGPLFVLGVLGRTRPDAPPIDVDDQIRAFLHGRAAR